VNWLIAQLRKGLNARTYVLAGALVAVLLWVQSLEVGQRAARAQSRATAAAPAPAPAAVAAAGMRRAAHGAVSPDWGQDPFARRFPGAGEEGAARAPRRGAAKGGAAARGAPAASGLHLQGVISGPLGRTALINGSMVREGERIGGREVIEIGRRSVVLLDQGTVTTLHLQGEK